MGLTDFIKKKKNLNGFVEETDVISIDYNIMRQEYLSGVQIGETSCINEMDEHFKWMRGFQNCFTGFPNDGKTQFTLYLMTIKSINHKWKWVVWSPEMKSGNFIDGKVKVHYNDLAYEIIAMITGKTPYKHIKDKYNFVDRVSLDELKECVDWIKKHFIFLEPRKRDIKSIYNLLNRIWEDQGFDGVLIDPFKNVDKETMKREDQHLHDVFAEFKDFSVKTNTVTNWIAHPKSNVTRVENRSEGNVLVPCNQYMLAGGAAWDNSMDGIYSIQRPFTLEDIESSQVAFHNLKQRKQNLVTRRGTVNNIHFNLKNSRYIFNGYDPMKLIKI